jgi:tetratricopeptide (TPR) repeat protein
MKTIIQNKTSIAFKLAIAILLISCSCQAKAQKTNLATKETLLKGLSENACKCVDSVSVYNKPKEEVTKELNRCIGAQVGAYQLGAKISGLDLDSVKDKAPEKDGKKQIDISINLNEDSREYKQYYYEIERYMMDNCSSLKMKVAAQDEQGDKSVSKNEEALKYYHKGVEASGKGDYKEAVKNFLKATKADPEFAFAWDNLGLSYRKLEKYDEAIEAYSKSLEIDPNGMMPLQNIAIVYQYKKEFDKAIKAYERLALLDKDNPEVFYGIGRIYAFELKDFEKGLENMCKAYNLYVAQKSPYRSDAEQVIQAVYSEMKKLGKEDRFYEILKQNNITANK